MRRASALPYRPSSALIDVPNASSPSTKASAELAAAAGRRPSRAPPLSSTATPDAPSFAPTNSWSASSWCRSNQEHRRRRRVPACDQVRHGDQACRRRPRAEVLGFDEPACLTQALADQRAPARRRSSRGRPDPHQRSRSRKARAPSKAATRAPCRHRRRSHRGSRRAPARARPRCDPRATRPALYRPAPPSACGATLTSESRRSRAESPCSCARSARRFT